MRWILRSMAPSGVCFSDPATTEIYTLSLHDALPISPPGFERRRRTDGDGRLHPDAVGHLLRGQRRWRQDEVDRKSTRLNSSHGYTSYAVFCLKKKSTAR